MRSPMEIVAGPVGITLLCLASAGGGAPRAAEPTADAFDCILRRQEPGEAGARWYRTVESPMRLDPATTAVIICDVWDEHHSRRAVDRLAEFAPRIAAVAEAVRARGGTVIHSPSDCMPAYRDHPARARAVAAAAGAAGSRTPTVAADWCCLLPGEERAEYPLDQSRGGEDDTQDERAAWSARLAAMGRNPGMPWKAQSPLVPIDGERDYVSDSGVEVDAILKSRGVRHVLLAGVHLNMCVLGRPFGLRRQVLAGRQVALVRDLTDTMYDPAQWPWVDHFTGTDRMIDHVERHVCPTVSSADFLGGSPFRSKCDGRPTVAIVVGESEYGTHETLPAFAHRHLGSRFRVVVHHSAPDDPHSIPGLASLDEADVLLLSVRRRGLRAGEMASLRAWIASGRPLVAIRTSSHAWEPRDAPADRESWPEFDRDVLGVEYSGHFANDATSTVHWKPSAGQLLFGIDRPIRQVGSLYKIAPVTGRTRVIAVGQTDADPPQPVVTSFTRPDGGLSIYTSLGHRDDLGRSEVARLLVNALHVAVGLEPPRATDDRDPDDPRLRWVSIDGAGGARDLVLRITERSASDSALRAWLRSVIVPGEEAAAGLRLRIPVESGPVEAWLDGTPLASTRTNDGGGSAGVRDVPASFSVAPTTLARGRPALLVIAFRDAVSLPTEPITLATANGSTIPVARLQVRLAEPDDDTAVLSCMPLPAQFGGSADAVVPLP